jgi:hypothetical protein
LQRVVNRNLRRLLNGVVIAPFVDVVIADDVRDKNAVALDADRLAAKTSFLLSLLLQAATGRSS